MSRRLISGPDLGAGFLYQLSFDTEEGSPPAFRFHAQSGGADASGPPIGPIDFLDYQFPAAACMFGGPRCWERSFFLGERRMAAVRNAYGRTRFSMAAMLAHRYEGRPVPFREGFEEFLTRATPVLVPAGVPYRVFGGAARWLREAGATPEVLQVEVGEGGAELVGQALEPFLIEPVADRGPENGVGGRAFLGTFQAGLRVEFGERPAGAGRASVRTEELPFAGFLVPVAGLSPAPVG